MTTSSRVSPVALALLTLWRLGVAVCGLVGVYFTVDEVDDFYYLSSLGSLAVGIVYIGLALVPVFTGGRTHEPPTAWPRGAMAVLMVLISLTSILFLHPGLDHTGLLFEHLVTPIVVVADYLFVGGAQLRTRPWEPLTWVLPPLLYFVFLLSTGVQAYANLFDPHNDDFVSTVLAFFAALILCGYALFGLARFIGTIRRPGADSATRTEMPATASR
ncbi:hypothetical protein AB0I28_29715 [Phytomonospora sp. NPDC050363]|uniref:hypothetical protein n=1 Tax=Phytomonospora sp. NPDC050363 TaxID=3155642 RepID=UPI0033DD67C5